MKKSKKEWALDTVAKGFPVAPAFWTNPDGSCSCGNTACKSPGKHPLTEHGVYDATKDVGQITAWWDRWPDANLIIPGADDRLYVDLDIKEGKTGIKTFADFLGVSTNDLEKMTYTVRTTSGGWHLHFKTDKAYSNHVGLLPGVDIRSSGGYVIGPGSTLWVADEFGQGMEEIPYVLINDRLPIELPEKLRGSLGAKKEKVDNRDTSAFEVMIDSPGQVSMAREMLRQREPAIEFQHGNHHTWVTACKVRDLNISEEKCRELMAVWNETCKPPWDLVELHQIIENAYKYASEQLGGKAAGGLEYALEHGLFDADDQDDFNAPSQLPEDFYKSEAEVAHGKFKPHLFRFNEFMALDLNYEMIVDGWLPATGYTALLGGRGGGKSTILVDLCCCLALDMKDWHTAAIDKGWTIVYLAGEDKEGVKDRFEAWCRFKKYDTIPSDRILIYDMSIDLLDTETVVEFAKFLRVELEGRNKLLFIVDTWQRMTASAGSQSDDHDMQMAVKNLEGLCRTFRGPSIIAAHPPKADQSTINGSLVIENNSQAIWRIEKTSPTLRKLVVSRIKGAPEDIKKDFRFTVQQIKGRTRQGKNRFAIVADYAGGDNQDSASPETMIYSPEEQALAEMIAEMKVKIGHVTEWNSEFFRLSDLIKFCHQVVNNEFPDDEHAKSWKATLEELGFTEKNCPLPEAVGFRTNRSLILRMVESLREKCLGAYPLRDGRKLQWEENSRNRSPAITIDATIDEMAKMAMQHMDATDDVVVEDADIQEDGI